MHNGLFIIIIIGFIIGIPFVGLFGINYEAFINNQKMDWDLGFIILKSGFSKFLLIVLDIILLYGFLINFPKWLKRVIKERRANKKNQKI